MFSATAEALVQPARQPGAGPSGLRNLATEEGALAETEQQDTVAESVQRSPAAGPSRPRAAPSRRPATPYQTPVRASRLPAGDVELPAEAEPSPPTPPTLKAIQLPSVVLESSDSDIPAEQQHGK